MDNNNYHLNKKIRTEPKIFILNTLNSKNYKFENPDILIIINSSNNFSLEFLESITKGGIKSNIKKIITSDSIIVRYLSLVYFSELFPNCETIQINSLENCFFLISQIIDNFIVIKNIEYKLNDYILINNCLNKYMYFFNSFFTGDLLNIKFVYLYNDINYDQVSCENEIINLDMIDKNNKLQDEKIEDLDIDRSLINNIYFTYIDSKRNIKFSKYITNIQKNCVFNNNLLL